MTEENEFLEAMKGFALLFLIAALIVGCDAILARAESAVISFTSAEGLKASVDSVLKANTKLDTMRYIISDTMAIKNGFGDDLFGSMRNYVTIDSAELIGVVVAEPIAEYDTIGDITIPDGKIDSTADGKIRAYDQEYYFVKQDDGSLLWGHHGWGGKAVIFWK